MKHVKLKKNFGDYRAGAIFAIVAHRMVYTSYVNHSLPVWVTDGKWIGYFEYGMKESPYTHFCITEDGYRDNSSLFEDCDPKSLISLRDMEKTNQILRSLIKNNQTGDGE